MDLSEIRKKAKEQKEAREKAKAADPAESASDAGDTGGGTGPTGALPDKPVKKRKKKTPAGRKPASAGKKEAPAAQDGQHDESGPPAGAGKADDTVKTPWAVEGPAPPDDAAGIMFDDEDLPLDTLMQDAFESERLKAEGGIFEQEGLRDAMDDAAFASAPDETVMQEEPDRKAKRSLPAADAVDEEDAGEERIIEYLAFLLADEEYAIRVDALKEIIRLQKVTMVPRSPDFVEGIFSLRGVIMPVFNIKKRLGFEDNARGRTNRILIVTDGTAAQGIIVDKVTGVARLREDGIEPPPSVIGGVEAEYLDGIGRLDGRLLILFNTAKVLSMEGINV